MMLSPARLWSMVSLVGLGLAAAGCGSGGGDGTQAQRERSSGANTVTIPAPGPTGRAADPAAVAVIRSWSSSLRNGDVRGAARFFALPSEMINGAGGGQASDIQIKSRRTAQAANLSLPCGAKLISADQRGKFVNALFQLTDRSGPGGSDCGAGGHTQTARTNFLIRHGMIVLWIRAPDDPGDNGGPGGRGGQPRPPPSSGGPAAPAV